MLAALKDVLLPVWKVFFFFFFSLTVSVSRWWMFEGKDVGSCDSTQGCTVSFKHAAQAEESAREALGEPAEGEDQPQVVSERLEHLELRGEAAGFEEPASSVGPICGSLKENESSKTPLNDQGKQNRSVVAQAASVKDPPEVIKGEEKELKSTNESGGLVGEDKDKADGGEVTRQLEALSGANLEPGTGSKIYFETSSKSHEEEISQSHYELGAKGEELHGKLGQKVADQPDERALSLNVPVGSSAGQITGANPKAFPEKLLTTLPGSCDQSEPLPLSNQWQLPPAVSVTPTSTKLSGDSSTDLETPERSEKPCSSVERSPALSEMLDLAGALPRELSDRRDLDHLRRKSMPSDVLGLSGTFLASLVLSDDAPRLGGESRFEEGGYCVFSEYSGPMPSPADVAPSPVDCLHQRFPSVERDVGGDLGTTEAEKVSEQKHEGMIHESSQKLIFDKKDSPVKSSLILEKAVPVGMKPDRLRIPTPSSKDRLTEFRLETGLLGDLKIQAIPEVDIEKDPSREASPIPPDISFTFSESGNKALQTPTTSMSPMDGADQTTMGDEGEKTGLDKNKGIEPQTATKAQHQGTRIEAKVTDDSSKDKHIQTQGTTPDICSPRAFASSTVIVIPQAQVEEEADDEDVEIAEEPQEIMEEPAVPPDKERAPMSLIRDAEKGWARPSGREDDPKSGDEWSQSSNAGEDGEPATDSSHLSPYSDYDRGEKKVVGVAEIRKEELGGRTETWKVEEEVDRDLEIGEEMNEASDVLCQSGEAENTESTQDVSCMDTDSGWMDSQGTPSL